METISGSKAVHGSSLTIPKAATKDELIGPDETGGFFVFQNRVPSVNPTFEQSRGIITHRPTNKAFKTETLI